MQLKSIVNFVCELPGFVCETARWNRDSESIDIPVRERKNSRPMCATCGRKRSAYDRLAQRRYQFVPLWQIPVYIVYSPRRADCPLCGIHVEVVPWAEGKSRSTKQYLLFLANWAKRLSWDEVATVFGSSWQTVARAVRMAVTWGREHADLSDVTAIGVDEIHYRRGTKLKAAGPKFLTLVYQINESRKRLLWVGKDRTEQTMNDFFNWFGKESTERIKFACSDMWPSFLKAIRIRAAGATQILDRFHVMANMNKAIDRTRAVEARELVRKNRGSVLANSRWLLLKRPENLSRPQHEKLAVIVRQNLKVTRAYLLRESFQRFWLYRSRSAAARFVDEWCQRAVRSRLPEMKKTAKSIRKHRDLLLNWLSAEGISMGAVEGLNNKAKVTIRKSYGFRTFKGVESALYHSLADLPQPEFTHRFW